MDSPGSPLGSHDLDAKERAEIMRAREEARAACVRDERLIGYYAWRDALRRGPGLPVALLWELAQRTKDLVPTLPDALAEMEWHIEHVLALARKVVNDLRREHGLPPVIFFTATDTLATHVYQTSAEGPLLGCETALPGPQADPDAFAPAICTCGRYVLERVSPHSA